MLNPYMNSPENTIGESDLYNDLVIEAIQVVGVNLLYIKRREEELNAFSEAELQKLEASFIIEAQVMQIDNFSGEADLFTPFGYIPQDSATFKMSISRFKQEAKGTGIVEPVEGDVIYMPISNTLWEIRRVGKDDVHYVSGQRYTYITQCVVYQPSHEEDNFDTQNLIFNDVLQNLGSTPTGNQDESEHIPKAAEQDIVEETDFDIDNPFGDLE